MGFSKPSQCDWRLLSASTLFQFACERIELIKRKIALHDQSNADTPATQRQNCVLLPTVWQYVTEYCSLGQWESDLYGVLDVLDRSLWSLESATCFPFIRLY